MHFARWLLAGPGQLDCHLAAGLLEELPVKTKSVTADELERRPLLETSQRELAVGVGARRRRFGPVGGLKHLGVRDGVALPVDHSAADRAEGAQDQWRHGLLLRLKRDPIRHGRRFARLANFHAVRGADHQAIRGLERAVFVGAWRAALEVHEIWRKQLAAALRPNLYRLVNDSPAVLRDDPAKKAARRLQPDCDQIGLGASARLFHEQKVVWGDGVRRDPDGNELIAYSHIANRRLPIWPGHDGERIGE